MIKFVEYLDKKIRRLRHNLHLQKTAKQIKKLDKIYDYIVHLYNISNVEDEALSLRKAYAELLLARNSLKKAHEQKLFDMKFNIQK